MSRNLEGTFGAEFLDEVQATEYGCGCGDFMRWMNEQLESRLAVEDPLDTK